MDASTKSTLALLGIAKDKVDGSGENDLIMIGMLQIALKVSI